MTTVRVGVGCFLFNSRYDFVTGIRKGSHGAGALQLPGGHLEVGESPEGCAVREVAEETGLTIRPENVKFFTATNDIFAAEGKHYITMFVSCMLEDDAVEPQVLEPEKCERWEWTSWDKLKELAASPDNNLFLPLGNLFLQRPDLDPRRLFHQSDIASYLSDLKSGSASVGSGRVLHYFNSGINPVSQIWYNTISSGMSTSAIAKASAAVTANTKAAAAALRTIATDSAVHASVHGSDFLIAGIPQLDLVPTFAHQIPSSYSSSQRSQAIALLKTLSDQWNPEMRTFTAALKGEVKNGRVFWYDMAALWSSMHSSSKSYGITASPVTSTCYNSSTGGVCTSPSNYLYFDTLHPVTSVHKL
ncbi:hypothetical protein JCM11641_003810 [Rhodosporidiobolus odoratus]